MIAAPKSFPVVDGELRATGLEAPVEVLRDSQGVPHIYAASVHDAFFAQGFVHAQDRFWQMDFWRHLGSGTLSEMFGKAQVRTDAFLRALGWRQVAERELELLSPEGKAILAAYAEGVNAWLEGRRGARAGLEYVILGLLSPSYRIEPWTPVHSLTWGKAMAWDLGGNMDDEIERAVLLKALGPERLADLYPPYPEDYPVIVPRIGAAPLAVAPRAPGTAAAPAPAAPPGEPSVAAAVLDSVSRNLGLLAPLLGPKGPDIGSNSWAVSGRRTASGKPLLANDMHLGIQMPSIWYQNALHAAPTPGAAAFDVSGFSFAGVPGVVAGHNGRIAWAFTNLGPDVQDLFVEKLNPANPDQYEYEGAWVDFEKRSELIRVAGGEAVEIVVKSSRHGPVISDSYGSLMDRAGKDGGADRLRDRVGVKLPESYAISLAWTALIPGSPFESIWSMNRAADWKEFRAAARLWTVPAQNLLYADVEGNIAYQTPGLIPIRGKGDGTFPVPGWTGEHEWTGYIPFEELPYSLNPDSGYIVTANNKASPRDYPRLLTMDWDYGQRAERIAQLLATAPPGIDESYFRSMHGDSRNLNAETLVPILLGLPLEPGLAAIRDRHLAGWDFQEDAGSKAAVLFETFWIRLLDRTFGDELPPGNGPRGGSRWYEVVRRIVADPANAWWDDKATPDRAEGRDETFARAFEDAVGELGKKYGKDLGRLPPWGKLHFAVFRNQTLGQSGIGLIEALFNRGPFGTGGGKGVVNATGWSPGSFEVDWLPSEREIVDLADLDASQAIHTTGQSGRPFHEHYDDMAPLWARLEYRPMLWERSSVEADAEGRLTLRP